MKKETTDTKKIQEAISHFQYGVSHGIFKEPVTSYASLAIKALKKELPQKVEIKSWSPAKCPCCEGLLSESEGDGYWNHHTHLEICPHCGQNLDWK